jgi:hypothetical protein
MRRFVAILVAVLVLSVWGCQPPAGSIAAGLQNKDPSVRIDAIVEAARTRDQRALPLLVERLSDSEEDVRFFAGIALERVTGQNMGWKFYDPPAQREQAVERWRAWLAQRARSSAATRPATTQEAS